MVTARTRRQVMLDVERTGSDAGSLKRDFEGTELRYGARHLKRAIEWHLVFPLANLSATRLLLGDALVADFEEDGHLSFYRVEDVRRARVSGQLLPIPILQGPSPLAA